METFYHGTSQLFNEFRPEDTIGQGEGNIKFGWGAYFTSEFATAVLYSGKGPGHSLNIDHYVYSVELESPFDHPDKFFILHKAVPANIIEWVETEICTIPNKEEICGWGGDFRKFLEGELYRKQYGEYPPSWKKTPGADNSKNIKSKKMAADWLYNHGIIGIVWPQGSWPKRGEDKVVTNFNVAVFRSKDIRITKVEKVEVEFNNKDKCIEKRNSERQTIKL